MALQRCMTTVSQQILKGSVNNHNYTSKMSNLSSLIWEMHQNRLLLPHLLPLLFHPMIFTACRDSMFLWNVLQNKSKSSSKHPIICVAENIFKMQQIERIANFLYRNELNKKNMLYLGLGKGNLKGMWDLAMTCSKDYNKVEEIQSLKSALKMIILYHFISILLSSDSHSTNRLDHSSYNSTTNHIRLFNFLLSQTSQ